MIEAIPVLDGCVPKGTHGTSGEDSIFAIPEIRKCTFYSVVENYDNNSAPVYSKVADEYDCFYIYIDPTNINDDAQDGSAEHPFANINEALYLARCLYYSGLTRTYYTPSTCAYVCIAATKPCVISAAYMPDADISVDFFEVIVIGSNEHSRITVQGLGTLGSAWGFVNCTMLDMDMSGGGYIHNCNIESTAIGIGLGRRRVRICLDSTLTDSAFNSSSTTASGGFMLNCTCRSRTISVGVMSDCDIILDDGSIRCTTINNCNISTLQHTTGHHTSEIDVGNIFNTTIDMDITLTYGRPEHFINLSGIAYNVNISVHIRLQDAASWKGMVVVLTESSLYSNLSVNSFIDVIPPTESEPVSGWYAYSDIGVVTDNGYMCVSTCHKDTYAYNGAKPPEGEDCY